MKPTRPNATILPADDTQTTPEPKKLPRGTRRVWSLVATALLLGGFARWQQNRPAMAEKNIGFEDGVAVLNVKLAKIPAESRGASLILSTQDAHAGIRYAAVDALSKEHTSAAVEAVERAFGDNAAEVRKRALEQLPDMDGTRGLRLLLTALRDSDTWIREDAVTQMNIRAGRKNTPVDARAVPMLIATLNNEDATVCSTQIHVLSKLTGHKWTISSLAGADKRAPVVAKWRQWWQIARATWPATGDLQDVPARQPERADPAPDFAFTDTNGKEWRRDALRGKVTLLNFWASNCGPCRNETPDLVRIQQEYKGRNLTLIGIAVGEQERRTQFYTYCRDNHIEYPQAFANDAILDAFGERQHFDIPVSVLLDTQGRIRYRWDGDRDYRTFQTAIERLLQETTSQDPKKL